ncbi:MAG: hypothetical protein H7250_10645 [Flavobacterium sp.]|nr:hypothetical protein [Flavobacterium sp.]
MKKIINLISIIIFGINSFGQSKVEKQTQAIVEEGKNLYKSEMASWYGTDLFLDKYKEKEKIGGYLSYTENEISKCIFFSKTEIPKVIGTMSFDETFNLQTAKTELEERELNQTELHLYQIRKITLKTINSDTIFKQFKDTNLNLIPLISNGEKKVYVLTGPQKNGVIIFGNDYLLKFDKNNNLLDRKRLHKNIIWTEFGQKMEDGKEIVAGTHTHLPETGDFITATDICTLMLYEKSTKWQQYYVYSKNYMSIWDCEKNQLTPISMKAIKKINKETEKQKEKDKKQK